MLVDDSPVNIVRAREAGITPATIVHPWNVQLVENDGVIGAADWPGLERSSTLCSIASADRIGAMSDATRTLSMDDPEPPRGAGASLPPRSQGGAAPPPSGRRARARLTDWGRSSASRA